MKARTIIPAIASLLLAACTTAGTGPGARTRGADASPATQLETRIYTSPACPAIGNQETFLNAIAGLVLKPLLEGAVYHIGDALKKAGEDQKTQVTETQSVDYYLVDWAPDADSQSKLKPNVGCYTIVHGALAKPDASLSTLRTNLLAKFPDDTEKLTEATLNAILAPGSDAATPAKAEFSDDIRLFARFSVESSDDKTAVQIKPLFVLIGEPFAEKKTFASGKRDIIVTVRMQGAGQSGLGDAFAIPSVSLKNAKTFSIVQGEEASELLTGWFPLAPVPPSSKEAIKSWDATKEAISNQEDLIKTLKETLQNGTKPGEGKDKGRQVPLTGEDRTGLAAEIKKATDALSPLKARAEKQPFTFTSPGAVSVTLTETRDGSKFLTDLGNYLTASKATIAKPFFDEIDPATREATATSSADSKDTLRISAIEAVATHKAAEAKTGEDRSETGIRVAKIKAEQACRKLNANGQFEADCVGY